MKRKSWQVNAMLWSAAVIPGLWAIPVHAAAYTWNSTSGGNWTNTTASGWNTGGAYPSVAGDTATFSQNITSDTTITLDTDATVAALTLTDATTPNFNWIINTSTSKTLTFDNSASAATLSTTSSSTTGSHLISTAITLNSNLTVSETGSGTNKQLTLSGVIGGVGGITVDAASTGVLILSNANNFTGTTNLNGGPSGNNTGTLRLTNAGALANSALVLNANTGIVTNGAILQLRSDTDNTLFTTASTTMKGTTTINVDQLTAGNTGKTLKIGPMTVAEVGANLNLNITGANGYGLSMGDITMGSTTGKRLAVFVSSANVTLANVTSLAPSTITDSFQLDGNGTGGGVGVVSGVISNGSSGGKVSLTKTNTSTWTLTNANTFTGATTISNGTLILGNALALQSSAVAISAANANALSFASGISTFTLGSLSGSGSFSLTDASSNGITLEVGNDNVANTSAYSGVMSGAGALTKIGSAQVLIGGASSNTYTGATTLNGGSIKLATSNALPVATSLVVNGGFLDMNALSQTVGQLSGSGGSVQNNNSLGTSTLTVTGTSTYGGIIADGNSSAKKVALAKTVGGVLNLTGNSNAYTGGTTISAGTLLVNNTTGSGTGTGNVTVSGTGTLGGSGRIAMTAGNMVTITSGTLSPGNSPGILTVVGTQTGVPTAGSATLNFTGSGIYAVDLNGTTMGTGYDSIDLTGNADLGGATLSVNLGMTLGANQVFTIIKNDASEAVLNTFAGLGQDATLPGISSNGYALKISYIGEASAITGGNDVVLYTTVIPEPATLSILSLGVIGLLARRHRRR